MDKSRIKSIAQICGAALLIGWQKLWAVISALSTLDFMRTASGHPSIGTFFMPVALADAINLFGLTILIYLMIRKAPL